MKAPFPWFGGKRRVADIVWRELGDVDNYVEPFFGSGAVLLERPDRHERKCETVNDADAFIANFWRAICADPDAVARWADWPVNECELLARHLWLVNSGRERIAAMENDPDFFDAKVAGWWVWGINQWIGGEWCSGKGPWRRDAGQGVSRRRPHLGNAGQGVNRKLPHLGSAGQGVHGDGKFAGGGSGAPANEWRDATMTGDGVLDYFYALCARLRKVRVCCGDWSRIVTDGALSYGATVGVFLDPPYALDIRDEGCYVEDSEGISDAVREWAVARGDDPRLRIVLCGYEEEHAAAMPASWRVHAYSASKAYGTAATVGSGEGNDANRHKERLWFSPHCVGARDVQTVLF